MRCIAAIQSVKVLSKNVRIRRNEDTHKVSSMLGLMMMGSMTASNVKFKTILEVSVKGSEDVVKIQDYLDQLFVGIVPLAVTLLAFWLLRKSQC